MPNPTKEQVGNSRISAEDKKKKKRRPNPENKYCDQSHEDKEQIEQRQE